MSPKFDFIGLPAELRLIIYKHLIQDVHVTLNGNKNRFTQHFWSELFPKPIDIEIILNYVNASDRHKVALLQASTWCLKDANEVLAANTTIKIISQKIDADDNKDKLTNIFSLVDPTFLKLVPAVHMSPQYFLRTDHTLFAQLKRVRLTAPQTPRVEHLSFAVHDLGCPRCGDLQGKHYYDHFWHSLDDGLMKQNQLRQLAEEKQGWDLDLTLVLENFEGVLLGHEDARIELRYAQATGTLMSKCLVQDGEVVLRDEEFGDPDRLVELGVLI